MSIFPIHTWLLGQVFKVMCARSWWCVASLFWHVWTITVGSSNFWWYCPNWQTQDCVSLAALSPILGWFLPPPAQDSLRTLEEGPSSTMSSRGQREQWWPWRCWWTNSMQTTVPLVEFTSCPWISQRTNHPSHILMRMGRRLEDNEHLLD